jgi:uncharacterized protein (TIGR03437 family)
MRSLRFYLRAPIRLFCGLLVITVLAIGQVGGGAPLSVVSGASFERGEAFAPGTLVTLFGSFEGLTQASAAPGQTVTSLGGAQVTVGGIAAPLLYTSGSQINLLIPSSLSQGEAELTVSRNGTVLGGSIIRIEGASPAIFLASGEASRPGLLILPNGMVAGRNNRISGGQLVKIAVTGLGTNPVARDVGAMLGLLHIYATGIEPVAPGVALVSFQLPNQLSDSGELPFALHTNGAQSNTVSVWAQ